MTYSPLSGNHVFGRETCPFTARARNDLAKAGIEYQWHDVTQDEQAYKEMVARVTALKGTNIRVTVPQIWLEGKYIGGSDDLREKMNNTGGDDDSPFCPMP